MLRFDHGRAAIPELDVTLDEREETVASITNGQPLTAKIDFDRKLQMIMRKGRKVDIRLVDGINHHFICKIPNNTP